MEVKSPLLNARQAAAMLLVCPTTLWRLTRDGQIPCVRVRRRIFYRQEALHDWILSQEQCEARA